MELNPNSPVPLYQQFKLLLERKLAAGEWAADEPLPTELSLMATFNISRTTVRQALDALVKEGRIYRRRGKGTFVAPPRIEQTLASLTGFAEELALRGLAPEISVAAWNVERVPLAVTGALELPAGTAVLHVRRLISLNRAPLFVDDCWFPAEFAPHLSAAHIEAHPIYRLLERFGRAPAEGDQRLQAIGAPEEIAPLLGVTPGQPALSVTRLTRDHAGVPVEYTRAIYRGDRYDYTISLRR